MRRIALMLATLAGCYRAPGVASCTTTCTADNPACPDGMTCGADNVCHGTNGPSCTNLDAPIAPDAAPIPIDARACFATNLTGFGEICPVGLLTDMSLNGPFDTNSGAACVDHVETDDPTRHVCVVVGRTIEIIGNLIVTGTRPLALIAIDRLTVVTDASLHFRGVVGSTALDSTDVSCATNPGGANVGAAGGGGGAGGAFQGAGGAGGGGSVGGAVGGGGLIAAVAPPTLLRRGCAGSSGGGGVGGGGGGGLYLIAGTAIDIEGAVDVIGNGGLAAASSAGGGGGGSGGMLVFETPMLTLDALVSADGGGGAGGGGTLASGMGADGRGGNRAMGSTGAATMTGKGGDGGNGSYTTNHAGTSGTSATSSGAGGGGGGGGAGYIYVFANQLSVVPTISPMPITGSYH